MAKDDEAISEGTTPQAARAYLPGVRQASEIRSARVESLRAVAALAVLEGHVFGASVGYGPSAYDSWWHRALLGGGFGVYLFFALSGYLLYLPFARRDFGSGRSIDLRRYALNRAVRILPLYYAVAVVYLAIFGARLREWALFLSFGENFSRATIGHIDGPMWSLVVELLFYLLLPFLAAALAALARGSLVRGSTLLLLLGVVSGSYRWVAYLSASHPSPLVQYNLPATFYFFVPGMLLALLKVQSEKRSHTWRVLNRGAVWIAGSLGCWSLVFLNYQWDLLAGAASFLLLGACVLPLNPPRVVRALDWRPLAVLGTASYSLYLWHKPIVDALAPRSLGGYVGHLLVGASVCVLAALLSYRVVEAPFLRLRRRWGDTASAPRGVDSPVWSARRFGLLRARQPRRAV